MRWYKHLNDLRRRPELLAIERELGEAGYARAIKLLEIVCQYGGTGSEFKPELHLKRQPFSEAWLASELGISGPELAQTMPVFSRAGLILARVWRKKIVRIPQLLEFKDEWSKKDSRATPNSLRSESGATPDQESVSEVDVEKEIRQDAQDAKTASRGHCVSSHSPAVLAVEKAFQEFGANEEAFNLLLWVIYRAANPKKPKKPQIPQTPEYYTKSAENFQSQHGEQGDQVLENAVDRFQKHAGAFVKERCPELLTWLETKWKELGAGRQGF
jgi:hypothetical protein